jgi:hypothetical protein
MADDAEIAVPYNHDLKSLEDVLALDLDMTHITERKGSPQTLVCMKTRRTYERQCKQHKHDSASMAVLRSLRPEEGGDMPSLTARMDLATGRS